MNNLGVYLQILGLALALCGLVVFLAWVLRRLRGLNPKGLSGAIQIKAIKPLTYKSQLVLVEVLGQRLLIGLGEGGPRLICELRGEGHEEGGP